MKQKETVIFKLTKQNLTTHNGFLWAPKKWMPKLSGKGGLCSNGFYHAYSHPLIAVFMNPIHADISNPLLWAGFGRGETESDHGLKIGFSQMKIEKQVELPNPTTVQRVAFALICSKDVYKEAAFVEFADKYLKGEDRSEKSARAWERAARAAEWAAAARAAEWAAAARAAEWAAAARAAEWAAAARAAEWAAAAGAAWDYTDKLIAAAEEAMKIQ